MNPFKCAYFKVGSSAHKPHMVTGPTWHSCVLCVHCALCELCALCTLCNAFTAQRREVRSLIFDLLHCRGGKDKNFPGSRLFCKNFPGEKVRKSVLSHSRQMRVKEFPAQGFISNCNVAHYYSEFFHWVSGALKRDQSESLERL